MSQYHGHPRSQNTAAGTPEPSPEISSQQPYPCNHQQVSGFLQPPAPFSQQLLSLSASRYAPNEHPLDWEILQLLSFQQDPDSQAVHQQFQPSHHVTTTTPDCHPLSDQRYSEKVIPTSSRGVGYPVLGEHLHDHNGDNSVWSSMDDLSLQNVQGSSIEPYNTSFEGYGYSQSQQHRTEQSIMHQPNALSRLDSWNGSPGLYQSDVISKNSRPEGMRFSPFPRSATKNYEAGGEVDIQLWNREIPPDRQWSDPQRI